MAAIWSGLVGATEEPETQVENRTWGTRGGVISLQLSVIRFGEEEPKTQAHTPCLGHPKKRRPRTDPSRLRVNLKVGRYDG